MKERRYPIATYIVAGLLFAFGLTAIGAGFFFLSQSSESASPRLPQIFGGGVVMTAIAIIMIRAEMRKR